uniref:Deoxyhypusine synthase n=1 Tax=Macrostomum lignano TaxID=282301 RepID=A0A1I8JS53_9PLAT
PCLSSPPQISQQAVLMQSGQLPEDVEHRAGFQTKSTECSTASSPKPEEARGAATAKWRLEVSNRIHTAGGPHELHHILAFTSNMISSGLCRESIRYLGRAQPELLLPLFESWLCPFLDAMLAEQNEQKINCELHLSNRIHRLGQERSTNRRVGALLVPPKTASLCFFALPSQTARAVTCCTFTATAVPASSCDAIEDIRLCEQPGGVSPANTGMIVLGGGVVKHHTCNANLMRTGPNFAVFVNTGQEFDGSGLRRQARRGRQLGQNPLDARGLKRKSASCSEGRAARLQRLRLRVKVTRRQAVGMSDKQKPVSTQRIKNPFILAAAAAGTRFETGQDRQAGSFGSYNPGGGYGYEGRVDCAAAGAENKYDRSRRAGKDWAEAFGSCDAGRMPRIEPAAWRRNGGVFSQMYSSGALGVRHRPRSWVSTGVGADEQRRS